MGRRLKGRIGIGWDIENEGERGSEDEGMQQEDSGGTIHSVLAVLPLRRVVRRAGGIV